MLSRCERLLSRTTSLFIWSPGYPGPPPPRGPILWLHTPLLGLFTAFRVLLMFMFLRQPCAGEFCSRWEGEQKGITGRQEFWDGECLILAFPHQFSTGYYQGRWTAARASMSRNRWKIVLPSPKQIHVALDWSPLSHTGIKCILWQVFRTGAQTPTDLLSSTIIVIKTNR